MGKKNVLINAKKIIFINMNLKENAIINVQMRQ